MSVWLVSVPNEGNRSAETTFLEVKSETASTRHDYAGKETRDASGLCSFFVCEMTDNVVFLLAARMLSC